MPRITIGMPVYQADHYLEAAVRSHLAQTYGDFEIIISDNGSTDQTETVARDLAASDARVRYVRHDSNRGAIWNLNFVASQAAGEFFKWSAHDDLIAPDFLAQCVAHMEADAACVLCFSRVTRIDANGETIADSLLTESERDGEGKTLGRSSSVHRRLRDVLLGGSWGIRSNGLIRASAMRETSPLLPYFGSEKVLVAELLLRGTYHELPEKLFLQRIHAAQSSNLASAKELQEFCDPTRRPTPALHHLRFARAYARAIRRASMSWSQRAACHWWLLRYLVQPEKWWRIVTRLMGGSAMKGGSHDLLQRIEHARSESASPSNSERGQAPSKQESVVPFGVNSPRATAIGEPVGENIH